MPFLSFQYVILFITVTAKAGQNENHLYGSDIIIRYGRADAMIWIWKFLVWIVAYLFVAESKRMQNNAQNVTQWFEWILSRK